MSPAASHASTAEVNGERGGEWGSQLATYYPDTQTVDGRNNSPTFLFLKKITIGESAADGRKQESDILYRNGRNCISDPPRWEGGELVRAEKCVLPTTLFSSVFLLLFVPALWESERAFPPLPNSREENFRDFPSFPLSLLLSPSFSLGS